jgi:membrane protein DedA with SNARE-associated domain
METIDNSTKYSIIGSIVVAILMIALGYYLTKVVENDKVLQKCDGDWYLKIIGWIMIIGNAITLCASGYMLYNLK